ncbi:MAG: helix-turn-helix domain-containing protein [Firmicutes bacterium]|nr:helix-turn-helix domain-containing protein [Bacillota bacterium]
MNPRLKDIRKFYNLTQAIFGGSVGVSASAISDIEKGKNNLTDQMIKLVCNEYNVNEEWLRHGTGEMFKPTDNSLIEQLAAKHKIGFYGKKAVEMLANVKEEDMEVVENLINNFFEKCLEERQIAATATTPNTQPTTAAAEPTAQPTQPPTEPPTTAATDPTTELLKQMQAQMAAMQAETNARITELQTTHATEIAEIKQTNAKLASENAEQAKTITQLQADKITMLESKHAEEIAQLQEQAKKTTADNNNLEQELQQLEEEERLRKKKHPLPISISLEETEQVN